MFGLILAGQLVRTDARPVSETQAVFDIADVSKSNHVVVFLTGQTPFPDGHGGAVYLGTAPENPVDAASNGGIVWVLLGHLSNEKPSAIFKISGLKKPAAAIAGNVLFGGGAAGLTQENQPSAGGAQIGVMVAPIVELAQQTPASAATAPTADSFAQFTAKMCANLFNYASSFAATPSQITPIGPNEQFVSMSVVQKWFDNFSRRMTMNPNYWKDL